VVSDQMHHYACTIFWDGKTCNCDQLISQGTLVYVPKDPKYDKSFDHIVFLPEEE
jgi:hypothetical protein